MRIFESNLFHSMMVDGIKSVYKEAVIGFNGRQITSFEQNMKLMALELDDRDMMVILFLLFCKRDSFRNHLLDCWDSKPSS